MLDQPERSILDNVKVVFISLLGICIYFIADHLNNGPYWNVTYRAEEFFIFLYSIFLLPVLFNYNNEKYTPVRNMMFALIVGFCVVNILHITKKMVGNVLHPRQWDFFDFYITSKIAATGGNIYSPELFHSIQLPVPPREDFINEVLNVGSKYPPQTSLFFALFGFFSFRISIVLFSLVQLLFLFLTVVEVGRRLDDRKEPLLIALTLLFLIAGTWKTMEYLAPNFIPLYLILRGLRVKNGVVSGVLLGLAAIFRPFVLIILAYYLIRKRFTPFVGVCISFLLTTIVSLAVFGPDTFMNYFVDGPFERAPVMSIYTHYSFCSVIAFFLRSKIVDPVWGSPFFHPLILVSLIPFFIVFMFILVKKIQNDFLAMAFLLPFAIIMYPETWWSYTVFLILPILDLYNRRGAVLEKWYFAMIMPVFFLFNDLIPARPNGIFLGLLLFTVFYSVFVIADKSERPSDERA